MLDKERERQLEMERNQLQALTKARADRKDEVAVMSDMLQLSKESVLVYRKWCLDSFVQVVALSQSLV